MKKILHFEMVVERLNNWLLQSISPTMYAFTKPNALAPIFMCNLVPNSFTGDNYIALSLSHKIKFSCFSGL